MARIQPVQIPGESPSSQPIGADDGDASAVDVGALQAQLAQVQAQLAAANAALVAQAAPAQAMPHGEVYTPVTPKGAAAMAASKFSHLTVAQLMAKIDAGEVQEPFISVLCADGYYARRA